MVMGATLREVPPNMELTRMLGSELEGLTERPEPRGARMRWECA